MPLAKHDERAAGEIDKPRDGGSARPVRSAATSNGIPARPRPVAGGRSRFFSARPDNSAAPSRHDLISPPDAGRTAPDVCADSSTRVIRPPRRRRGSVNGPLVGVDVEFYVNRNTNTPLA
ncbi:hypothetical protein EVAR_14645_1 [Eumeta japonica]|uniref:Uncharacterized protein n=1 Tax=Eumeta variegata TaxID=151549 RepID=A0A4C1U3I7_EUMVA|nr:hypothetical protein EVAR_14645_1 [Eumeta japonica]